MDKSRDNTKVCATDIKIGARLSIAGLVKMAIDFTMSKVNKEAGSDERHGFASATGDYGASSVSDPTGVAVAWGHEARAKGCKGAHLILSDWKYVGARYSDGDYMDPYDKESWELTGAKMVVVDGEKIKEDTYYRCIEGEIVEVTEDGEIVEE
jgi:collagen, type I/II/III/V/XI, alpha